MQVALCILAVVALCAAVVFEDWQRIVLSLVLAVGLTAVAVFVR